MASGITDTNPTTNRPPANDDELFEFLNDLFKHGWLEKTETAPNHFKVTLTEKGRKWWEANR